MLSFKEAAKYLDRHEQTLEHYHKRGLLVPDQIWGMNGDRRYSQETLDRFRTEYLQSPFVTVEEIARRYNKTRATVHYHLKKKRVSPAGKRGNTLTFLESDVMHIAQQAKWI